MTEKKILIVEDNFEIAEIVSIILERDGHEITGIVESGENALLSAATITPDVVISDIGLAGEIDGIETATYISHLFRTPVIFMTGAVDQETIERANSAEPYGYLAKPFNKSELLSTVSLAIRAFELNMKAKESGTRKIPSCVKQMCLYEEGIVITNPSGRILYINPYTENLTGLSNAEMLLKPLSEILHFSGNTGFDPGALSQAAYLGEDEETVFLKDRSGGNIMVRVRIVPRRYRDEDTVGVIITIKEISEEKSAGARDAGTLYRPDTGSAAA
ncbi:response regulator [Methanolacinia petrolearia]|uniref:ATP-binding response regulator n=1 Tax=Methanolacinia petrolearia TaxID=54120 RepID=UPI003BACB11D